MEFCGMKRESDRKCLNHARVHANAQSFDRCEPLARYNTGSPRFTDFPSLCECSESSLTNKAPVVQRLDNAIQRINRNPVVKCSQNKPRYPLDVIYPVDSVIHPLNNPGLIGCGLNLLCLQSHSKPE